MLGSTTVTFKKLLDIGSGDGCVTKKFTPIVEHISVTEVSANMCKNLRKIDFIDEVYELETLPEGLFDLVACLNVLDRCNRPSDLLNDIKKRLVPVTGRFILALVLPYCPFVEDGAKQKKPD
jgi:SAM-dependent methyltransferase